MVDGDEKVLLEEFMSKMSKPEEISISLSSQISSWRPIKRKSPKVGSGDRQSKLFLPIFFLLA